MLVSPIFGLLVLGGHDCFYSEYRELTAEPDIPQQGRAAWNSVSRKTLIGYRDMRGKTRAAFHNCNSFILCRLD